jgi:hypothetical protein
VLEGPSSLLFLISMKQGPLQSRLYCDMGKIKEPARISIAFPLQQVRVIQPAQER